MKKYKCTVHWNDESKIQIYEVFDNQYLLPQLENYGIPINYDCREGVCASCQAFLLKGKVIDQYGEEKTEQDTEIIKTCVCYPQSDIEIKLFD